MPNYLDKKELEKEIIKSKELNSLTDEATRMLMRMVKEISRGMSYKFIEDKKDCMSEAFFDIVKYWRNFDPNYKNANCFSFYTQLIKNGLAKGWKKIHPIKKVDIVSIDPETGIHNI